MTTEAQRRRSDDTIVALLDQRVGQVETATSTIGQQLTKHVTECAAVQKKVLLMTVFLAGWVVAHSPEGLNIMGRVLRAVVP